MNKVCYIYEVWVESPIGGYPVGHFLSEDSANEAKESHDREFDNKSDKALIFRHVLKS